MVGKVSENEAGSIRRRSAKEWLRDLFSPRKKGANTQNGSTIELHEDESLEASSLVDSREEKAKDLLDETISHHKEKDAPQRRFDQIIASSQNTERRRSKNPPKPAHEGALSPEGKMYARLSIKSTDNAPRSERLIAFRGAIKAAAAEAKEVESSGRSLNGDANLDDMPIGLAKLRGITYEPADRKRELATIGGALDTKDQLRSRTPSPNNTSTPTSARTDTQSPASELSSDQSPNTQKSKDSRSVTPIQVNGKEKEEDVIDRSKVSQSPVQDLKPKRKSSESNTVRRSLQAELDKLPDAVLEEVPANTNVPKGNAPFIDKLPSTYNNTAEFVNAQVVKAEPVQVVPLPKEVGDNQPTLQQAPTVLQHTPSVSGIPAEQLPQEFFVASNAAVGKDDEDGSTCSVSLSEPPSPVIPQKNNGPADPAKAEKLEAIRRLSDSSPSKQQQAVRDSVTIQRSRGRSFIKKMERVVAQSAIRKKEAQQDKLIREKEAEQAEINRRNSAVVENLLTKLERATVVQSSENLNANYTNTLSTAAPLLEEKLDAANNNLHPVSRTSQTRRASKIVPLGHLRPELNTSQTFNELDLAIAQALHSLTQPESPATPTPTRAQSKVPDTKNAAKRIEAEESHSDQEESTTKEYSFGSNDVSDSEGDGKPFIKTARAVLKDTNEKAINAIVDAYVTKYHSPSAKNVQDYNRALGLASPAALKAAEEIIAKNANNPEFFGQEDSQESRSSGDQEEESSETLQKKAAAKQNQQRFVELQQRRNPSPEQITPVANPLPQNDKSTETADLSEKDAASPNESQVSSEEKSSSNSQLLDNKDVNEIVGHTGKPTFREKVSALFDKVYNGLTGRTQERIQHKVVSTNKQLLRSQGTAIADLFNKEIITPAAHQALSDYEASLQETYSRTYGSDEGESLEEASEGTSVEESGQETSKDKNDSTVVVAASPVSRRKTSLGNSSEVVKAFATKNRSFFGLEEVSSSEELSNSRSTSPRGRKPFFKTKDLEKLADINSSDESSEVFAKQTPPGFINRIKERFAKWSETKKQEKLEEAKAGHASNPKITRFLNWVERKFAHTEQAVVVATPVATEPVVTASMEREETSVTTVSMTKKEVTVAITRPAEKVKDENDASPVTWAEIRARGTRLKELEEITRGTANKENLSPGDKGKEDVSSQKAAEPDLPAYYTTKHRKSAKQQEGQEKTSSFYAVQKESGSQPLPAWAERIQTMASKETAASKLYKNCSPLEGFRENALVTPLKDTKAVSTRSL